MWCVTKPLREGVRAVILDPHDRILLVRFELPDGGLWATPGGGIESGETPESAIRRELHEEVGLVELELGPMIWRRTHEFSLMADYRGQREVFYLVRSGARWIAPALSREELVAEGVTESRWWTLGEIRESREERFAPRQLAHFLTELIDNGPPQHVLDTGV